MAEHRLTVYAPSANQHIEEMPAEVPGQGLSAKF